METPKIYLDMDGVLADFFSEYAKMAGVNSGNYRNIPQEKVEATLDAMIGTDFFARLPMFPNVPKLLKLVLSYTDHYNICSSPLRGDGANSEKYKRIWIKQHLNPQPKDIIITNNKSTYATQSDGTPNILIDDRGLNINGWNGAGGIGIKYQADEDSLEIVKRALDKAFKKDVGEPEKDDAEQKQEWYNREDLPQIRNKDLKHIPHTLETVNLDSIVPVQKERIKENLQRQYKRLKENKLEPIIVDKDYRIINGHHRYEILKQLNSTYIDVAKIDESLEIIIKLSSPIEQEGALIPNPKNTHVVRTDSPYDFIRLGSHLGNPAEVDPDDFNPGVGSPDTGLVFYGGDKEKEMAHKYIKRLGYKVQPGDGYTDMHYDDKKANEAVQYKAPKLDYEWEEAQRYPALAKLGLGGWKKLQGKRVNVRQLGGLQKIGNHSAPDQNTANKNLPNLEQGKVKRTQAMVKSGVVELPIVVKLPNGKMDLLGGNTRFTSLVAMGIDPDVWYIDASGLKENFADGKNLPDEFLKSKFYDESDDCKESTKKFVEFMKSKRLPEPKVIWLAPPKDIKKFPGKSGQGDAHIMPIVGNDAIDFTAKQFGVNQIPFITPMSKVKQVYNKIGGYYTDAPDWVPGKTTHIIGTFNSLPQKALGLAENFADGKKPGRKGLAKRSGVDCKQSVSKLRSIAKSSSGEKQRMAHWCANMKSGKKK